MEGERFKENSLNKREITRNESSPEQKECEEVTESDNSTVAQQQISNVCSALAIFSLSDCCDSAVNL